MAKFISASITFISRHPINYGFFGSSSLTIKNITVDPSENMFFALSGGE